LLTSAANAQLNGIFDDALSVDQSFVTGASSATDIAFAADGRAVVTTKNGDIVVRKLDGTTVTSSDTFPNLDTDSEKGLTGVVADPTQANAFFFYADNGPSDTDKHRVYHGVLDSTDALTVDLAHPIVGKGVNAQDEGLEGPANHDGGGLFVYDGHLYVSVGDTGANTSPPTNKYGSCLNKGNGKILRVNLDGTIPSDNPLVGVPSVTACDSVNADWSTAAPDERIFAWGLRNPFRFWVDAHTGRMWIGDVGEVTREEISVSDPAAGYSGQHFGYPFREGLLDWDTNGGTLADHDCNVDFSPSRACTDPVTDYTHDVGNCVIGGLIPEGCGWNNAFGGTLYYWFADNGYGWVRALTVKSDRSGVVSATPSDVGAFDGAGPSAIRQGPGGAIYLVNNWAGSVFEIKPKDQMGSDCISAGGAGGSGAGGMNNGGTNAGGSGATSEGGNSGAESAGESGAAGVSAAPSTGGTRSGSSGGKGGSGTATGGKGGTRSGAGGSATNGGNGNGGEAGAGDSAGGTAGSANGGGVGRATGGSAGRSGAGSGAAGGSVGETSQGDSGCGCRTGRTGEPVGAGLFALLAVMSGVVRRRRRR